MKVEVRSMKYYILMKCIGYLTLFSSEAKYDDASQVIRVGRLRRLDSSLDGNIQKG